MRGGERGALKAFSRGEKGRGMRGRVVKMAFWNVVGVGGKDREFWKEMTEWDIIVMTETWLEEKGWERLRGRMSRGYRWEVQLASRKNRKRRAMGGMSMGVRKGIEVIEGVEGRETEGMIMRMVRIGEEKWRIIGVYANGNVKGIWERIRGWEDDRRKGIRTIVGGDFNARTGEDGWSGGMRKGGGDRGTRR